MKLLDQEFQAN